MATQSAAQRFALLTRDVDWQRASFLSNNLEIVWPPEQDQAVDAPAEIIVRRILDHYLLLALLFYRQLRNDLLEQFRDGKITNEREVKILMQTGMDKLVREWYRVYAAILSVRASQSSKKAREIMQCMQPVLQVAREDVHLSPDFLAILHFGQDYSMRFFNYLEDIAALNMPLASFESPWEWTILWHELAGEKVRSLINRDSYFFENILEDLLKQLEEGQMAEAQSLGWSDAWVEELFEDSFSVASFPIHFLYVFKNLLERYADIGGEGTRHPPQAVRLAVAMSFHLQRKGFTTLPDLQNWGETTWRNTWQELMDSAEQKPTRFAQFDPAVLLAHPLHLRLAWLVAERILSWHNQPTRSNADHDSVHQFVDNAIIEYSRGKEREKILADTLAGLTPVVESIGGSMGRHTPDQPLAQIEEVVQSKSIPNNNQILDALEMQNQKVRRLLRNGSEATAGKLGYQDLLAIPFDDVDYGVEIVNEVRIATELQPRFAEAKLRSRIVPAPAGSVSFKLGGEIKFTNKHDWNNAATLDFQIP